MTFAMALFVQHYGQARFENVLDMRMLDLPIITITIVMVIAITLLMKIFCCLIFANYGCFKCNV